MELTLSSKKNCWNKKNTQFEIHPIESFFEGSTDRRFSIFYNGYSIIWIIKGAGEITLDMETCEIEDDTIYYTRPGKCLSLHVNDDVRGYIINYGPEFLHLYDKRTSRPLNSMTSGQFSSIHIIEIDVLASSFLQSIANSMVLELRNFFDLMDEVLKELLTLFILQLRRQPGKTPAAKIVTRKTEMVNAFYSLLERQITKKKRVKDYAERLAVSPGYLNETVKELSGFSASFHIQQRIVFEAKRRAVVDGYSLKEIAYHLGFFDPAHFSKYFKNGSGMNFSEFKKGMSGVC